MGYFSKRDALKTLESELDKLLELEEQVKKGKQDLQDLATILLASLPEDEQIEAATVIYWTYAKWVNVSAIAEALDVKVGDVCSIVGSGTITLSCRECGTPVSIALSSRSDYAIHRRSRWTYCESCTAKSAKRYAEHTAKQAALREAELERLKAMPYPEYLKTDHWKTTRTRALKRARFRCQLCNAKNVSLHVHHRTYVNLGHEANDDLIVLCSDCHRKFHDIDTAAASTA